MDKKMCFVIQPKTKFNDYLFDNVFVDAIENFGLTPLRNDFDEDNGLYLENINDSIKAADLVIGEVSTDNPKIWYELGYALAMKKQIIMVYSPTIRHTKFPFNVGHRRVILYNSEDINDITALKTSIIGAIKAIIRQNNIINLVKAPVLSRVNPDEIPEKERVALVIVYANNIDARGGVSSYLVVNEMYKAGYSKTAAHAALSQLVERGYLATRMIVNEDQEGPDYTSYSLTPQGKDWLVSYVAKIELYGDGLTKEDSMVEDLGL